MKIENCKFYNMKLLLFTLEYPPFKGGVANYYGNLVHFWPAHSKDPQSESSSASYAADEFTDEGIDVLNNHKNQLINNWLRPRWLPALFMLYRCLRTKEYQHLIVGHILPLGWIAYLIVKLIPIPYTVFLHGMDFTFALKTRRKREQAKKILKKAKHIICANSYTAKMVKEFLGPEMAAKVEIVNPGVDISARPSLTEIEYLREKYNLYDKKILFSIGRLIKRKGFDKVIEVMPKIAKTNPDLYYVLAGNGPDRKYIHALAKKNKNVIFLGAIDDLEKQAWLAMAEIFIMPAREIDGDFEGFGIVYLEANLAGTALIAGDSGGVRDAVKDRYSGLLVEPENNGQIFNAITKLIKDAPLRKKLVTQGRERVKKEFRWEDKVREIFNIISNL